ncbi:MAG: glycosyltransferase [Phycisphaerales bacterium]|nr:glycosyltransferase [Phycisphaerales bacterium]
MRTSVIISTFDKPHYLARTLAGMGAQLRQPDEVLIADDGSAEPTREVIRRFRDSVSFPVIHVRQEHSGWRKCRVMNRCIRESTGDYVVFTDGDCIHRRDWLAAHARFARPGRLLAGGDLRLNDIVTRAITADDVASGRAFQPRWLMNNGMKWRRTMVKVLTPRAIAPFLDWINFTPARFGGSNASCWREDAIRVAGFDERFGWGKEDTEMGQRLRNLGLSPHHVRYNALCLHLDHERNPVPPGSQERNFAMLAEVKQSRRTVAIRSLLLGVNEPEEDFTVERDSRPASERTPSEPALLLSA